MGGGGMGMGSGGLLFSSTMIAPDQGTQMDQQQQQQITNRPMSLPNYGQSQQQLMGAGPLQQGEQVWP